jgi:hypothetical protein
MAYTLLVVLSSPMTNLVHVYTVPIARVRVSAILLFVFSAGFMKLFVVGGVTPF